MMISARCLLSLISHLVAAVCFLLGNAAWAETVDVPPGLGVKPTGRLETVVYTQTTGTLPNTVNRKLIEGTCQQLVSLGKEKRMPTFEAGFDEPLSFTSERFTSADGRRRAIVNTTTAYRCEAAEAKSGGMCGCAYRQLVGTVSYLDRQGSMGKEQWRADLERKTGTHYSGVGASALPKQPGADGLAAWAGAVVGRERVAGLACELRRQDLGSTRTERCFVLPESGAPTVLHGQLVSETVFQNSGDRGKPLRSSKTIRVSVQAQVDGAVFEPPVGVSYQTVATPPREPQ